MRKRYYLIAMSLLAVALCSGCASLAMSISDPDWHKVQGSMYAKTDPLSGEEEIRDYMTLGHSNEFALYIKRMGNGAPALMADAYYQTDSPGNLGLIKNAIVYDADNTDNRVEITFNPHATQYDVGNGWWSASSTAGRIQPADYDMLYQILKAPNPSIRLIVTDGFVESHVDLYISRNANYRALKVLEYYNSIV